MRGLEPHAHVAGSLSETLRLAAAHERLVFLCSFQKEESVILDELLVIAPHVRVVTIDTGVLFEETLETWRAFEEHFGVEIEAEQAHGALHWSGPEHCCGAQKVAALERALNGADAWVTGLRREQGPTRAATELVELDGKRVARGGPIAKYNPLALWTERDLWQRINERGLPYHPLHDEGYASIGCVPCTERGDGREGRWAGAEKSECGLHV
ncbi:MAG: phosphoadenylyl-sulfate reductase [Actinomycetota bacterium]|nr:phosphoadenylyl-sulfate reductase [Actinomycetota bacterium]